jgi:hypothetical protein
LSTQERIFQRDVNARKLWRSKMDKMKILGALAFSAALAVTVPAMAQQHGGHGGGGGFHGGGGAFHGAGGFHGGASLQGMHGGGLRSGAMSGGSFRNAATVGGVNARAGVSPGRTDGFTGRQPFSGGYGRDWQHDHQGHGYGRRSGFVAGLAAGSALGYGYDGGYYGDSYAYDDEGGEPAYVVANQDDTGYCGQRYRSYDPASGTYLGYDGLRHPCP